MNHVGKRTVAARVIAALDQDESAVERESVTLSAGSDSAPSLLLPSATRGERLDELNALGILLRAPGMNRTKE